MSLRPITPVAGLAPPADADRGPVPEQRWLQIADLVVDEAYQRPITSSGLATIRAIVAHFDWRMFAPVVACPVESGLYAIVDGQHRVTAAATCGIERVPCHVIQADRVAQARSFDAINARVTRMTGAALFKARLAAGDPLARRVAAAGEAAGVRVLTYTPNSASVRPRETTALRAIEAGLGAYGDSIVRLGLAAAAAPAAEHPGLLRTSVVAAFFNVLADHAEWSGHAHLVETCALFRLEEAIDRAKVEAAQRRMPAQPLLEAALVTFLERRLGAGAEQARESAHA